MVETNETQVKLAHTDLPTVAIVGRPNVGKSSLVNRLIGRREAIVEDMPGVTRDRKEIIAVWDDKAFNVVDTGGWLQTKDPLGAKVTRQAELAVGMADAIVFVVDALTGPTTEDQQIAAMLHRNVSADRVVVVVNKCDNSIREDERWAFMSLGYGEPIAMSTLHAKGTGDLLDRVTTIIDVRSSQSEHSLDAQHVLDNERQALIDEHQSSDYGSLEPIVELESSSGEWRSNSHTTGDSNSPKIDRSEWIPSVAIVGRPNVGKSTLFNRLVGDERSIVHDMPGTTRDSIDTLVETNEGSIRFLDTAGMRRKARIDSSAEYYSWIRALQTIEKADVAILVVDALTGVSHQDQRIAERLDLAGTAAVVLLNKWELVDPLDRDRIVADVEDRLGFLSYAPILRGSALTGKGVHKLLPAISAALVAYRSRVSTRILNKVIENAQQAHPAPNGRVLYATQGAIDPPTFTLFVSREVPHTWLRYLERKIREELKLGPTPIKLRVRKRKV